MEHSSAPDKSRRWRTRTKFVIFATVGTVAVFATLALVIVVGIWGFPAPLPRELQAPPPAILPSLRSERAVAERQRAAVTRPVTGGHGHRTEAAVKAPAYKTHEEYLLARRAAGADPLAIDLYLEIVQRWDKECRRDFTLLNLDRWAPGKAPLTAEQAAWIGTRADFLTLVRRYTATSGVPVPTIQENLDELETRGQSVYRDFRSWRISGALSDLGGLTIMHGRSRIFYDCSEMLAAEGTLRMAAGHADEAVADVQAALKLPTMDGSVNSLFMSAPIDDGALNLIAAWLRGGVPLGKTHCRELLAVLDGLQARKLSLEAVTRPLEEQYLYQRAAVVQLLARPWQAYLGSIRKGPGVNGDYGGWWTVPLISKKISYPHLGAFSIEALRALETRRHTAELIQAYDTFWREGLESLARPYPELHAATHGRLGPEVDPKLARLFFSDALSPKLFSSRRLNIERAKAQVNLVRAALTLTAEHGSSPGAGERRQLEPVSDSPWLDPFSGKALRLDDPTSPTLIYSVGADLRDQGGRAGDDLGLELK